MGSMPTTFTRSVHHPGVINIPLKNGQRGRKRGFYRMAARSDFFVVNEVLNRRAKVGLASVAVRAGWGTAGLYGSPNPIFFDRKVYRKVSTEIVVLHDAAPSKAARRKPGYNAKRVANVSTFIHLETGQRHVVIGIHLVADSKYVDDAWAARVRQVSIKKLTDLVEKHARLGAVVWVLGDTNIRDPFRLGVGFVWIRPVGIDKAGVATPYGITVLDHDFEVIEVPVEVSDHRKALLTKVVLAIKH